MLFHITQTHSPENCSAHKPERQANLAKIFSTAQDHGVTIKGAYANAPAHTIYVLAETDSALALSRLLAPVLEYGHYRIEPVTDAQELMATLQE